MSMLKKINDSDRKKYLKPRPKDWHKGLSGHVLIVGGYLGTTGAVLMAGIAALRSGAGLVNIATHPDTIPIIQSTYPELMCHAISNGKALKPFIDKADVIVLGPGLSQNNWSQHLYQICISSEKNLVMDADALNLLAQNKIKKSNWILTPHPGEAAKLLKTTATYIQKDRLKSIQRIVEIYGGICVLKGAGTLVYQKDEVPAICHAGNPGMATAGMGDILSGVIAGLLAQKIPSFQAAKLGVYIHALAGDLAKSEGERGMIATDLLPYIRKLVNMHHA